MSFEAKPLRDVRVLLVDDDNDARELFSFALRDAGAEVRTAFDAVEAMRTVAAWSPTVVVSDLSMPTTDGFSLLVEMRSLPQLRQIPAIAVSGRTSDADRAAANAAGYQQHAANPLNPDDLVGIVARWALQAAPRP